MSAAFLRAPVEARPPVFDETAQIRHVGAELPRVAGRLVGEARPREARAQIGDVFIGNMQGERNWRLAHGVAHLLAVDLEHGPAKVDRLAARAKPGSAALFA